MYCFLRIFIVIIIILFIGPYSKFEVLPRMFNKSKKRRGNCSYYVYFKRMPYYYDIIAHHPDL